MLALSAPYPLGGVLLGKGLLLQVHSLARTTNQSPSIFQKIWIPNPIVVLYTGRAKTRSQFFQFVEFFKMNVFIVFIVFIILASFESFCVAYWV